MNAAEIKDDDDFTQKIEAFQLGNTRFLSHSICGGSPLTLSFHFVRVVLEELKEHEESP